VGHFDLSHLAWELPPAVEPQPEFAQEVARHVGIVGTLHSPEAQLFLILLQQLQRPFELLHRRIE